MTKNLPILYLVDSSVAVTGGFISARNVARVMAGFLRIVLVLPQGSSIGAEELQDFWRVEYLPIIRLSKNISAILLYLPALFKAAWLLQKLMKKDGARYLQINDFFLMHGMVLRLFGFSGYIVTWIRCNPKNFAGPLAKPMLFCANKSSNRIVAVSAFIRSLLPRGYPAEVIYDCYSGPVRSPRIWPQNEEKTFVYIGNYINGKGQDIALRAFAIAAPYDASLRLSFYGGDMGLQKNRDYRQKLEATSKQLGLQERVSFGDFHAYTYPVLEQAFAALNFSNSESFSLTVLEAAGAGLPVIATASGGPQEIMKEGIMALIVPVGDIASAADRMLRLAQNPTVATTMGQAGAEHIREHFSPDILRMKLQSVFDL